MKRAFLLLAFAMLAATFALAANMGAEAATGQNPQNSRTRGAAVYQNPDVTTWSAETSQTVIRGCLSGSSGNYTLTDQNGMQFHITGDDARLHPMVGKEVEITGFQNLTSRPGETTSRISNGVQATDVRAVSSTCYKGSSVSAPPPVGNNGVQPKPTPENSEPPKQ